MRRLAMVRSARWIGLGVIAALVGAESASAQTTCDRTCLRTILDQYLNAVIKHEPTAAPLVVGFRQTENAITCGRAMACGRPSPAWARYSVDSSIRCRPTRE